MLLDDISIEPGAWLKLESSRGLERECLEALGVWSKLGNLVKSEVIPGHKVGVLEGPGNLLQT